MTFYNPQTGCIMDVQQSNQLEAGESQDLCGNFAVASMVYAGLADKGPRGSAEDIDVLADWLASNFNSGPVNEQGSTIQDMYNYMAAVKDPQSGGRALHWQEIDLDTASIRIAVLAGYPVLVTANEQNIRSVKTGARPPYPWNLNANHILPIIGVTKDNNWIVGDYLNNNFQNEWPCIYDASVLSPSWGAAIRLIGPDLNRPWLDVIPSGSPRTWDTGFNAQLFDVDHYKPLYPNVQLSIKAALAAAMVAGFTGNALTIIVSIAMAESGLNTHPTDNVNTDGSRDRGILQFNTRWHPEVTDAMAYNVQPSFASAFTVSNSGKDFSQWSTFTNGAYKQYMVQVNNVVNPPWQQQAHDVWMASVAASHYPTGISGKWFSLYPTTTLGPPTSVEIVTVDFTGNACIAQFFGNYRIELVNSKYTLYGPTGPGRAL